MLKSRADQLPLRSTPSCFEHRPRHLGDGDAHHHLVLALDGEGVDDGAGRRPGKADADAVLTGRRRVAALADERLSDVDRLLRFRRGGDRPGEQDGVAGRLDLDPRPRHRRPERLAQDVEVASDVDLDGGDLPAVRIHDVDRRGAVGHSDQKDFPGRAHDRVRDGRVRDEDFFGVPRQVDDDRTPDREIEAVRDRLLQTRADRGRAHGRPRAESAARA